MQVSERSTNLKPKRRRVMLRAAVVACALLLLVGGAWLALVDTHVQAAEPPLVDVQAALHVAVQQEATIGLTMTVSSRNECGTSDSATILVGRPVYFCYTVTNRETNSGAVPLTNHIIADAAVSTVHASFNYDLQPGATVNSYDPAIGQVISATVSASETRTDTWVANNGSVQAQASDSVTIDAVNPSITVDQRVGRSPSECSTITPYLVPATTPVYLCLTITNTGDTLLNEHTLYLSALSYTTTITHNLPPGQSLRINSENMSAFNIPSLTIPSVNTVIASTFRSVSRTPENFSAIDSKSIHISVGTARVTLAGAVRTELIADRTDCPATGSNNITTEISSTVFYCLHLTNTGNITLGYHHITAITPTIDLNITYNLPPSATVIITNGLLAALGSPQVLGPHIAGRTLNSTFIVTSTNNAAFRSVASTSITAAIFVPTNTPTPTNTSEPATPTYTPSITPTPFPTQTPLPSWTPTFTPVAPTPTWTRSFAISSIDTPTPGPEVAQAALATQNAPTVDTQATAFAEATLFAIETANARGAPESPLALPDSPLATPDSVVLTEQALAALLLPATPEPLPTSTETPTPTHTPRPSATPTPTATPTATMRPLVMPTAPPPPDVATILTQVLGSSIATTSIIFLVTGTIVFFATLGAVVGFGFLRNNNRRFELDESDAASADDLATAAAMPYPPATQADRARRTPRPNNPRASASRASQARADDNWPSELP